MLCNILSGKLCLVTFILSGKKSYVTYFQIFLVKNAMLQIFFEPMKMNHSPRYFYTKRKEEKKRKEEDKNLKNNKERKKTE